jgi:hypothetical protein
MMAGGNLRDLVMVERYLKEIREDVVRQTALVRTLTQDGRDAAIEAQVLTNMKGALDALEWRAAQLRRAKHTTMAMAG